MGEVENCSRCGSYEWNRERRKYLIKRETCKCFNCGKVEVWNVVSPSGKVVVKHMKTFERAKLMADLVEAAYNDGQEAVAK